MARSPRRRFPDAARRTVAAVWLSTFVLLWAMLPAIDARATHVRTGTSDALAGETARTTAAGGSMAALGTDGCALCKLLRSCGGVPSATCPLDYRSAADGAQLGGQFSQPVTAHRARAGARAPPAA